MIITVDAHPLLLASAFITEFPRPLQELPCPPNLASLLSAGAAAPVQADDTLRSNIRALLRHGGFKPSGRSKPASEYLVRAAAEGTLDSINAAVDACNVVSLHSGIPISVIDLDRAREPFRIGLAADGERYVFNQSGQEMDLRGLLCLYDAEGACANSVKDSQRTKTHGGTTRTLTVMWSHQSLPEQTREATGWYRDLLGCVAAKTEMIHLTGVTDPLAK